MKLGLIAFAVATAFTHSAVADIYQWYDGDGDGSLWLSSANAEPNADLYSDTLWWADLAGTDLSYSVLAYSNFQYADASGAVFLGASAGYSDWSFANLSNVQFGWVSGSSFLEVSFYGANLQFANFGIGGNNFEHADMRNADLRGANMWYMEEWYINYEGAMYDESTVIPEQWLGRGWTPESQGMVYLPIPAPATLALLSLAALTTRRRRS